MSFREKTAWISMLSMASIYGFYFWSVLRSRTGASGLAFGGLLGTIVALAVVQTVLTIVIAVCAPRESQAPRDERERLIDLKATRFAYAALASGLMCACFFSGYNPPILFSPNAFLFLLVAAEILRSGCQIVQYRRAA